MILKYGARGDEHSRRYDHDHLRHRPSFRHGPYLPEHHGRYLLRLLRDQVGEQEEVNQSTRSTKGKAA